MRTRMLAPVMSCALVVLLAGCSGDDAPAETTDSSPAAEETQAKQTEEAEEEDSGLTDVTSDLQDAAGDLVTKAETETGGGWLYVDTSITDPRTDDSTEAAQALEICETSLSLGYESVYVRESDGSTFVVAGHPSYGEDCTEV